MTRLLIHVEGETEETFVNEVLASHLYHHGLTSVSPRLLGNARAQMRRGGIRGWDSAKADIVKHLREDGECYTTLMVDYYALPATGQRAWPGRDQASNRSFARKATTVQDAIAHEIAASMGSSFRQERFIPYVMMHEFEGLLFSDCEAFASAIGAPQHEPEFQRIRDQFSSPEEINDSPSTAPSKRVLRIIPGYQKPLMGTLAAIQIGLEKMREECPLFNSWVARLEQIPSLR